MPTTTDHGPPEPGLVALDWGTTNQRAWLLDRRGRLLDSRASARGLLRTTEGLDTAGPQVRERVWTAAFDELCGHWLAGRPEVPVVACGMVGSAQGWVDAGYRRVPAAVTPDPERLVRAPHPHRPVWVVPGLRIPSDGDRPGDVLRGEETQLLGVLDELPGPAGERTVVLPGTHTKWLRTDGAKVTGFTTTITGELFALEMEHGILGRTAGGERRRDDGAFRRGLAAGDAARGLAGDLFTARALVLDGLLDAAALADYVSGLMIGHEVRTLLPAHARGGDEVVVCGSAELTRRYRTALATHDVGTHELPDDVVVRGLRAVAVAAGLLPTTEEAR